MRYALSRDGNGKPITVGEAQRLAKNEVITTGADRTTNKLQYTLLGDPALALRLPIAKIVVDSIKELQFRLLNLYGFRQAVRRQPRDI